MVILEDSTMESVVGDRWRRRRLGVVVVGSIEEEDSLDSDWDGVDWMEFVAVKAIFVEDWWGDDGMPKE